MKTRRVLVRTGLVAAAAAAGAAAIALFVATRAPLPERPVAERAQAVRVVAAETMSARPRARGYGEVVPARSWRAVADVAGRAVERHPDYAEGSVIEAGASILRIDPTEYRLALDQTDARIAAVEARLAALTVRADNLERSIAIQARARDLAKRSYARAKTLVGRGALPESTRDEREERYLSQEARLQDLRNAARLIPSERRELDATLSELEAQRARQAEDLAATEIRAPFRMRLAEAPVEGDQHVTRGETVAIGDGVDAMEIEVDMPVADLRTVLASYGFDRDRDLARLNERLRAERIPAHVRLRTSAGDGEWRGRLARIGDGLSVGTRTARVIVRVADPYGAAGRYPLLKNMYVEVDLLGRAGQGVVAPRAALRSGRLSAADANDRLTFLDAEPLYRIGPALVFAPEALTPGVRLLLDQPMPAVEGALLAPERDAAAAARLREAVAGAPAEAAAPGEDGR